VKGVPTRVGRITSALPSIHVAARPLVALLALGLAVLGERSVLLQENLFAIILYSLAFVSWIVFSSLPPPAALSRAEGGSERGVDVTSISSIEDASATRRRAYTPRLRLLSQARRRAQLRFGNRHGLLALIVLEVALLAPSGLLLSRNISNPVGGWLWAAALVVAVGASWLAAPTSVQALLPGPDTPDAPRVPLRWEVAALASILAVGVGLRVWNIEYMPPVMGDEGERGLVARAIAQGEFRPLFGDGWWTVPNAYFYFLAGSLKLFGDSVAGGRVSSIASGMVWIVAAYWIGRTLWSGRVGLLAAGLMASSPLAMQFSRVATEATPMGALWALGFGFLFRGLRAGGWINWALAGLCWGLGLYTYAASKLILGVVPLLAAYCVIRWRREGLALYAPGLTLLVAVMLLTFLPYGIFQSQINWGGFSGRAAEMSIFAPQNQARMFEARGLSFGRDWFDGKSTVETILAHPMEWAQLLLLQIRTSMEVLYRKGDATEFFSTTPHNGMFLHPVLAALTILGLAFAVWRVWDPRFGLLNIWFWSAMMAVVVTIDTPSGQRIAGAWPMVMVLPAIVLDRALRAVEGLGHSAARGFAVAAVPLFLLAWVFVGAQEYFRDYAATCVFCNVTTQARYAESLGGKFKVYQLSFGDNIFFGHGTTRFIAKGVDGQDVHSPSETLPITTNDGKNVAFIVYPSNVKYLPIIKAVYPAGSEEQVVSSDGKLRFTGYRLAPGQVEARQQVQATYTSIRATTAMVREEPRIGTEAAGRSPAWEPPLGLEFPATAQWSGALLVPAFGVYVFSLDGERATLEIDGNRVLGDAGPTQFQTNQRQATVVLAKGLHDVRLFGTLSGPSSRLGVRWGGDAASLTGIAPRYLFNGSTGGLSGEVWRQEPAAPFSDLRTLPDGNLGISLTARRTDSFIGFRESAAAFGRTAFVARWRGTIHIPKDDTYGFQTRSRGASLLLIDGSSVVNNAGTGEGREESNTLLLTAGPHSIELRYAWMDGASPLELFWKLPNEGWELVPPAVLRPDERLWSPSAMANAPSPRID